MEILNRQRTTCDPTHVRAPFSVRGALVMTCILPVLDPVQTKETHLMQPSGTSSLAHPIKPCVDRFPLFTKVFGDFGNNDLKSFRLASTATNPSTDQGLRLTGFQAPPDQVSFPFTLESNQRTEVRSKIEGYVQTVHVDIGDRVRKGVPLITLHVPELLAEVFRREKMVVRAKMSVQVAKDKVVTAEARLRQAQAAKKTEGARMKMHRAKQSRFASLVASGAIEQQRLDEANYGVDSVAAAIAGVSADIAAAKADVAASKGAVRFAESSVEVANADLKRSRARASYTTITAPFDGTISGRNVDPGQLVNPGSTAPQPLLIVEQVSLLRGVLYVPANQVKLINVGSVIEITDLNNQGKIPFKTDQQPTISRISGVLDTKSRMMRVEFDLPNPLAKDGKEFRFRSGGYGTVRIIAKKDLGTKQPDSSGKLQKSDSEESKGDS